MAFTPEPIKTPVAIGNISITLVDRVTTDDEPASQTGSFNIRILFDDWSADLRKGDLGPHLEPGERDALMGFMDTLRARAEAQIIGS